MLLLSSATSFGEWSVDIVILVATSLVVYLNVFQPRTRFERWLRTHYRRYRSAVLVLLPLSVISLSAMAAVRRDGWGHPPGYYIYKGFQQLTLSASEPLVPKKLGQVSPLASLLDETIRGLTMLTFVVLGLEVVQSVMRGSRNELKLLTMQNRKVVCGLGPVGEAITRHLARDRGGNVVAIDPQVSEVLAEELRELGVVVLVDDPNDKQVLRDAHIDRAKDVFVTMRSDAENLGIAAAISQLTSADSTNKQRCIIHVTNPDLADYIDELREDRQSRLSNVRVINSQIAAADHLVTQACAEHLRQRKAAHSPLHFVLWGFGSTGQTLALRIAKLAHLSDRMRPRLTVLYRCAEERNDVERFLGRYPSFTFEQSADATWSDSTGHLSWADRTQRPIVDRQTEPPGVEFVCNAVFAAQPADIGHLPFVKWLADQSTSDVTPVVVVCDSDTPAEADASAAQAVILWKRLAALQAALPIYVHLPTRQHLAELVATPRSDRNGSTLKPFGTLQRGDLIAEMVCGTMDAKAEQLHQSYLRLRGRQSPDEANTSNVAWSDLPARKRRANRDAVAAIPIKLAAMGIDESEIPSEVPAETLELGAIVEHNRWMATTLLLDGRYGQNYSDNPPVRPTLIAWEHLSDEDREKDIDQLRTSLKLAAEPSGDC